MYKNIPEEVGSDLVKLKARTVTKTNVLAEETNLFKNPESNVNKNLKYLRNAMDVRARLPQFHPQSEMECLSKNRSDIVVIKRGIGLKTVFTIHNMTENKINYRLTDQVLAKLIKNDLNMQDYLTSNKEYLLANEPEI